MGMLGLERKARTYDLTDYVVEQYGAHEPEEP
jgi:hypothetical protein